jgi:hypothetical protein
MEKSKNAVRILIAGVTALLLVAMTNTAFAQDFFQGFEHSGLFDYGQGVIHTSPSGSTVETDYAVGINASSGNFLARLSVQPTVDVNDSGNTTCAPGSSTCVGPFTMWGLAYNAVTPLNGVPVQNGGSVDGVDIYLDVNYAGTNPDYRFDWDSALSDSEGSFLQDYIFNTGTGNPAQPVSCAPTSGGYFVIAASNNSQRGSAYPQDPSKMPQCVTKSGWYTFQHYFHPDNKKNLEVDMTITNSQNHVVASWTMHPTCMGTQVTENLCSSGAPLPFSAIGANAYGWFPDQEIDNLAIDNLFLNQECQSFFPGFGGQGCGQNNGFPHGGHNGFGFPRFFQHGW